MDDKKEYKLIKSIGKGSFGEVFLTKKANSPKLYATKMIPISNFKNEELNKYLLNEINIMNQLNHPNIIKLYDIREKNDNKLLVMDYINGGSLADYFANYKYINGTPFPQKMIQFFVKQIVQGLIYIHSINIIHRDLKLDNILLDFPPNIKAEDRIYTQAKVKIIDFGLSTQLKGDDLAKSVVGSPLFMDPIILQKYDKAGGIDKFKYYDEKADIWSLGAITYEMLTGQNIFKAKDLPDLLHQVEKGNYFLEIKDLSSEIISFLNSMLQYNPRNRLTSKQLATHQFLTTDPDKFTKADIARIENKIEDGVLTINIFNNSTIGNLFPYKPALCSTLNLNRGSIPPEIIEVKQTTPTLKEDINNINRNVISCIQNKPKQVNHNYRHKVKFEVQRMDNKQENINFKISFLVKENIIWDKDVHLTEENDFHDEWIWEFNNDDWKNIDNNNDNFLMTIKFNEYESKEELMEKVESIKLGKPYTFVAKNFIKFTLVPLVFRK